MRKLAIPAAALAVCVPLSAQEDHFTSSPQGFEGTEGNMSIDLIGNEALLRYQQVDAFTFGGKTNRNRILWRRDGLTATNPAFGSRNIDMEFSHGEGDLSTMSTNFSGNYSAVAEQVVITRKVINFPDWSAAPAIAPQAESAAMIIFTDVVGWGYPGKATSGTDFVWEVKVWSNDKAGTGYPMDADSVVPTHVTATGGTAVNPTCFATGFGSGRGANTHVDVSNYGTHFDMHLDVGDIEVGQNAFVMLGNTLASTPTPFCGNLEVVPLLTVPLGPTDPTGYAEVKFTNLTYNAALIGATIHGQGAGFDSVQGMVLNRTRSVTVPADPPVGTQVKHMWALDPTAATATSGIQNGGIIMLTNHP